MDRFIAYISPLLPQNFKAFKINMDRFIDERADCFLNALVDLKSIWIDL